MSITTSRPSKFYWEKTAEEIANDDELMRLEDEANMALEEDDGAIPTTPSRNHLKSFSFFRLPLFEHPSATTLARIGSYSTVQSARLSTEVAVFHDTLLVLAEAVKTLNFQAFLGPTRVSCTEEKSWESGATFYNFINAVQTRGITGNIRFKVID